MPGVVTDRSFLYRERPITLQVSTNVQLHISESTSTSMKPLHLQEKLSVSEALNILKICIIASGRGHIYKVD